MYAQTQPAGMPGYPLTCPAYMSSLLIGGQPGSHALSRVSYGAPQGGSGSLASSSPQIAQSHPPRPSARMTSPDWMRERQPSQSLS